MRNLTKKIIIFALSITMVMSLCGAKTTTHAGEMLYKIAFPSYYSEDCPAQGNIQTLSIDGEMDVKVYTPYNYDVNKQYDVILLLHGSGGTIDDWLTREYNVFYRTDGNYLSCRKIYDWAIYENKIKPIIVATVDNEVNYSYTNFGEKMNDAFRVIIDNFGTYAEDFSDEAMYAARDHFIVGGLSMGSCMTLRYLLETKGFPANAILLSGFIDVRSHLPLLNENEYLFNKVFIGCGEKDEKFYDEAYFTQSKLENYIDECEFRIYRYGHDWHAWTAGIYDALLFLVPSEEPANNWTKLAEKFQYNIKAICLKTKEITIT